MTININSCMESLSNPNGRFRTLDGLYPATGANDELRMSVTDISVDFEVVIGGEDYILKCILSRDEQVMERLKEIATFTSLIQSRFLTKFIYLEEELLIFDSADNYRYIDVVIERVPDGKRIDNYIKKLLEEQIELPVKGILKGVIDLIRWMDSNSFSHGRISPTALWVDPLTQQLTLSDYNLSSRKSPEQDIRGLGVIAIGSYILGAEPRFFTLPRVKDRDSGWESSRRFLNMLPTITDIISNDEPEQLTNLIKMLNNRSLSERIIVSDLCKAIEELAECPIQRIDSISDMVDLVDNTLRVWRYGAPDRPYELEKRYQFVGQMNDMLMRVFDGRRWYYIDKKGDVVLDGDFIYANDFYNGRAVVETATGYGLIDTQGEFVIAPDCDDIECDNIGNIVLVTRSGLSGIYTREGGSVTGLVYDQIINSSEGLILVKKDRRFGYIRCDGSVAIDLIYEDAFSFKNGVTRVRHNGRDYIIDSTGLMVSEIFSEKANSVPVAQCLIVTS